MKYCKIKIIHYNDFKFNKHKDFDKVKKMYTNIKNIYCRKLEKKTLDMDFNLMHT